MELRAEHGALEVLRVVVPVSNEDVLPVGGLQQGEDPCQDLRVGGALYGFICFEVHRNHHDGSGFCFPKESLVATASNCKGLQLGQSVGSVMNDENTPIIALIGAVGVCWVSESMSAPDLKVLAHGLVFLLVQVSLDQHVDLVVSGPVPVEGALAKRCDVGHIQPHRVLCVSCFFGWGAVEWWIVVRALGWWQGPGDLPRGGQGRGLDAPDLHNLACHLGRQEGQDFGWGAIVFQPHQVFVHQNGVVVARVVGGASVTNVCHWEVLGTGS